MCPPTALVLLFELRLWPPCRALQGLPPKLTGRQRRGHPSSSLPLFQCLQRPVCTWSQDSPEMMGQSEMQ